MENYIFSMKNGSKIRVPLSDAKSVQSDIAEAVSKADDTTQSVNYVFTYNNGVIRINLLELVAMYPESNEVK